jgi:cysteine desulfurase family protein
MEHNSIIRPLRKLEQKLNIKISIVKCKETGDVEPKDYEKEVRKNTKLICLLHASNITGTIMPVAKVGEIAKKHNITYLVDAAQSAGTVPIDVNGMNVDLLAFSGHKSLLGPTGTGALYIKEGLKLDSLKEGGTGSHSELDVQPDVFPDKYESGTINDVGIVGLGASVKFILDTSVEKIQKKRAELTSYLLQEIKHIKKIKLYGLSSVKNRTSVVSFNIHGIAPIKVGEILDKKYRIVTRTGLHCSPLAHKAIGTYPIGTVRVSFGYFNTLSEVKYLIYALKEIMKGE